MVEIQKPIVKYRKVVRQGGSHYISIPPGWFEAHGIDPEHLDLLVVANTDIRIVNPEHEAEVYETVSKMAKKANI